MTSNDRDIHRVRELARVLDTAFGIPGTPVRIGLDAILGLIPGAGDVIGAALSSVIVLVAVRNSAPPAVLWRMLGNVAVDTAIGAIPLIGDLFDVAWKANSKNAELLARYAEHPEKVTTRSRALGILVVILVLLALIGLGTLAVMSARFVWQLLSA